MMLFPLYISFNGRSRSFFSKTGEWGGRTVRFLYAVNVVILIIFFWSFYNDTNVVWISKTVSIDANYLLKLETFLIHFDEGKGTCMRSSEEQLFPGEKKRKKRWWKVGNLLTFFLFIVTLIKLNVNGLNRLKAKNHRENLYQSGKVFLSESNIFHWIGDRPNFGQKLMGCSLGGQFVGRRNDKLPVAFWQRIIWRLGDKQSLDANIFIHSWYLPQPAILIFRNIIGGHVYD